MDPYLVQVCQNDRCKQKCLAFPDSFYGQWSATWCGYTGNRVLFTKNLPGLFQFTEVEIYGKGEDSLGFVVSLLYIVLSAFQNVSSRFCFPKTLCYQIVTLCASGYENW